MTFLMTGPKMATINVPGYGARHVDAQVRGIPDQDFLHTGVYRRKGVVDFGDDPVGPLTHLQEAGVVSLY